MTADELAKRQLEGRVMRAADRANKAVNYGEPRHDYGDPAAVAVAWLVADLRTDDGLRARWDALDDPARAELVAAWTAIVRTAWTETAAGTRPNERAAHTRKGMALMSNKEIAHGVRMARETADVHAAKGLTPPHDTRNPAAVIAARIVADLGARRGLRQTWHEIDADVRAEIVTVWTAIATDAIDEARNRK